MRSPRLQRILVVADTVVLAVGWAIVQAVFAQRAPAGEGPTSYRMAGTIVVGVLIGLFLMSANGLYKRRICQVRSLELARVVRLSVALTALAILGTAGAGLETALLAGVSGGLFWHLALGVERGFLREWIHGRRARGDYRAPVLVVGSGDEAVRAAEFLDQHPVLGFDVLGILGPRPPAELGTATWLGEQDQTARFAEELGASGVVVDGGSLTGNELNEAVRRFRSENLHVHVASGLRGVDWRRITVSPLADETFLHIAPPALTGLQPIAKRTLDLVMSSLLLVVAAPVLAVLSLAIWANDRGPVLFQQTRVGLDGREFKVLKLRTMVVDAESRLAQLQGDNERAGPLFKLDRDPRVTSIGRFLRGTSLDELPQLFNVLRGDMSMVGPRPALPAEMEQFDDELSSRVDVKPGITGLWQVEARDLASFDLYRRYDLLYVENWSITLDLAIIARTITATLLRAANAATPTGPVGRRHAEAAE